eukprot:TRINITY_DN4022_c0_g1_i1.p1 TRINITY_DN4022_c0_g1~~TRINITY_DN4022_c0_g1_i1.p1  ORF type:complete len:697 (+),score=109.76 TRINITY_DN4022_c0_g1_i1:97-2187(+)
MELLLEQHAHWALHHRLYTDAVFLAERLRAHADSPRSVHLLASAYLAAGDTAHAFAILHDWRVTAKGGWVDRISSAARPHDHDSLALLYADCAIRLDRLKDAKAVLQSDCIPMNSNPVAYYLLGIVNRRLQSITQAIDCFRMAVELNPFLFSALEQLVSLGAAVEVKDVYSHSNPYIESLSNEYDLPNSMADSTPIHVLDATPRSDDLPQFGVTDGATPVSFESTSNTPINESNHTPQYQASQVTPATNERYLRSTAKAARLAPKPTIAARGGVKLNYNSSFEQSPAASQIAEPKAYGPRSKVRVTPLSIPESSNLSMDSNSSPKIQSSPRSVFNFMMNFKSQKRQETPRDLQSSPMIEPPHTNPVQEVCQLLGRIATAVQLINSFSCKEAIAEFERLEPKQKNTAWVYCQIGRAYTEIEDFEKAKEAYEKCRRLEPHRISGLDLYSTVLFKLKKEVELTQLANEVVERNRHSAEAWCIAGNALGLVREHMNAIKMFKRALQLDPYYTYPNTLIGLEYLACDEFEKSINYFRKSLALDPRHYRALLGLGQVYRTQGLYDYAEAYLTKIFNIHQKSSSAFCTYGMILLEKGDAKAAIGHLNRALIHQSKNSLAQFLKAQCYFKLTQYQNCVDELDRLIDHHPREAKAHFLLSMAYKKLSKNAEAFLSYQAGANLDPTCQTLNHLEDPQGADDSDMDS